MLTEMEKNTLRQMLATMPQQALIQKMAEYSIMNDEQIRIEIEKWKSLIVARLNAQKSAIEAKLLEFS